MLSYTLSHSGTEAHFLTTIKPLAENFEMIDNYCYKRRTVLQEITTYGGFHKVINCRRVEVSFLLYSGLQHCENSLV